MSPGRGTAVPDGPGHRPTDRASGQGAEGLAARPGEVEPTRSVRRDEVNVLEAVMAGDVDEVRALVAADPTAACVRDEQGLSATLHALYRGRADMVAVLLAAG